MKQEGFTQGKWQILKDHPVFYGKLIIVVKDEENSTPLKNKYKMICEMTEIRGDSFTDNYEHTKANAALISQAPAMYKALQDAVDLIKDLFSSPKDHDPILDTISDIFKKVNPKQ